MQLIDTAKLDEFLDTKLYPDPTARTPLDRVIDLFRASLPAKERRIWTKGAIEAALEGRIDVQREGRKKVKTLPGYSETNPTEARQIKQREAEAREVSEREIEAKVKRKHDAYLAVSREVEGGLADYGDLSHFVYAPGARVSLVEIVTRWNESFPPAPIRRHMTVDDARTILAWWHDYFLDGNYLLDHCWCPEMIRPDGKLKRHWEAHKSRPQAPRELVGARIGARPTQEARTNRVE